MSEESYNRDKKTSRRFVMKQSVERILFLIIIVLFILFAFWTYQYANFEFLNLTLSTNQLTAVIFIIFILVLVLYTLSFIHGRKKNRELRHRDQLFNSLIKNSSAIYLMCTRETRELIYFTNNVKSVLGIKEESEQSEETLLRQFFDLPIVKNELRTWDKRSDYVSQMFSYQTPLYQHKRWLRFKIFPFQDRKANYDVLVISDATKEHDQQHLLLLQARDIKLREQQLNQITAMAYDLEWDVNVSSDEIAFRELKDGVSYFGTRIRGNYQTELEAIVEKFIVEEDQRKVYDVLCIKNLKKLSEESLLEPLSIRYRLAGTLETIWLESTVFFTTTKDEIKVIVLTKNVTEDAEYMRRQNALLQTALQDAEKANEAKSKFLTVVSHEIRTPMNVIIGLSESILNEELSKGIREDVEAINSASTNLLNVIDGILDISKVEKGTLTLDEKEYNVPKLFKDVEGITKEWIGSKQIELELKIDPKLPESLFGDRGKIHQVLLNLLNNAVKFTDEGKIILTANFEKRGDSIDFMVSIADTGVGIPKEKLDSLFSDSKVDGDLIGMGLTITKNLIATLKGQLTVESVEGKGSVFTFIVKQQIRSEKEIGRLEDYREAKRKSDVFTATGKRVLIVDDDKLNLKVGSRLLQPYGVQVETADSGKKAIDLVKKNEYDLILLDQMMPEMDGIATVKELKTIPLFHTPIVALTADAIVGMKEKYLKEGFDDYLAKPIDSKELSKILKKYLKVQ